MPEQLIAYFTASELQTLINESGGGDIKITCTLTAKNDGTGDVATTITAEAYDTTKAATVGTILDGCPHPCTRT